MLGDGINIHCKQWGFINYTYIGQLDFKLYNPGIYRHQIDYSLDNLGDGINHFYTVKNFKIYYLIIHFQKTIFKRIT